MKLPGADHPISIAPNPKRVVVSFAGRTVADTTRGLALKEANYRTVHYIPREDVDMTLLERTAHASVCPYKGVASYYSIRVGERRAENAAWSYENPFDAVAPIKGHLAFYPDRVDSVEERPA